MALNRAGLWPITLGPKEGLALVNGTHVMAGIATLGVLRAERLRAAADVIGAMSLEAYLATERVFDHRLNDLRPHPGQTQVAENMLALLDGSGDCAIARTVRSRTRSVFISGAVP